MTIHGFLRGLMIFNLLALSAQADVFFNREGKTFIKVESISSMQGQRAVRYSICEANYNFQSAACRALAAVTADQFSSMRNCLIGKMVGNGVEVAATTFLGVVLFLPTGGVGSVAVGGAGAAHISHSSVQIGTKMHIFSEKNLSGQDDIIFDPLVGPEDYAQTISNSIEHSYLSCDVSGGSLKISHDVYQVRTAQSERDQLYNVMYQ